MVLLQNASMVIIVKDLASGIRDKLANLQLLEGVPNEEKSSKEFKKWLYARHANDIDRRDFMRKHYIPEIELDFKNFKEFMDKRKDLIKQKFKEILPFAGDGQQSEDVASAPSTLVVPASDFQSLTGDRENDKYIVFKAIQKESEYRGLKFRYRPTDDRDHFSFEITGGEYTVNGTVVGSDNRKSGRHLAWNFRDDL
jgi:hypothetical protein